MTVTVTLPDELMKFVDEKIAAGRYTSSSDVVRDALRLMRAVERQDSESLASLRQAWQDGIAGGDAGAIDFGELKREARARLAATKA